MFLNLEVRSQLGFPSGYYKRRLCSGRVRGHSHRNALPLLPRGGRLPGKSQHGEAETS